MCFVNLMYTFCLLQFVQLLACDWLLEARQAHWEAEHADIEFDGFWPVSSIVLEKFQRDLNALRTVVDDLSVSEMNLDLIID